ncbi:hypothetical protein D8770_26315 [Methylobacterium sp. DB1607]|nr:hypothetical protein [Methylobacterium sp. DB1607]
MKNKASVCFVYAYVAVCGLQAMSGRYVAMGRMPERDEADPAEAESPAAQAPAAAPPPSARPPVPPTPPPAPRTAPPPRRRSSWL